MFPDYGRNVAKLVESVRKIEDRAERTRAAEKVVTVMGQINPKVRETGNWRLKMWEHLMMMVNWELDVDVPEGVQRQASMAFRPEKVAYPAGRIMFKHYGQFLQGMIAKAVEMPEGEERDTLVGEIASQMKRMYLKWNRDTVNDDLIRMQLDRLSGGKIVLPEDFRFVETKRLLQEMRDESGAKRNMVGMQPNRGPMQQRFKSNKKRKRK